MVSRRKSASLPSSAVKLTFVSIFLLGINGIIGSGTFLMPQEIYKNAGFLLGMGVILFAGISTTLIAFAYADMSGKFSEGGGAWLYAYTAFGKFTGFQVGFFMWFAGIVAIAAEIAALIRIFKNVVPALKSDVVSILCGTVVILILGLISWFGVKSVQWVNNISTLMKVGTAVLFIVVGVFFLKFSNFEPLTVSESGGGIFSEFNATYAIVFYMFTGFSFLPVAARRMKDPRKDLPRALVLVMLSVTAIYLLVQFVVVGVLGPETAKTTIPVATAMLHTVGEWGYYVVVVGSAVSVFGVAFVSSFEVPLIASTLAEEHELLPPILGKTNRFGAPAVSILLTVVISSLLLWTGSYVFLATCMVCANFIQYVPTILAVIKLRNRPSAPGALTLKGPWVWIVSLLALASSMYVLTGFNWKVILVAVAVFAVATIIYFADGRIRSAGHQVSVEGAAKTGARLQAASEGSAHVGNAATAGQ